MFEEFKKFAMRGNVIDMAVGIIIGAAFGKIVSGFVNDIIMPPLGLLLGGMDFSNLAITLQQKTATHAAVTLQYGAFINTIVNFLIISFSIFIVIKQMNRLKKPTPKKPADKKNCEFCDSSISIKATRCPNCTAILTKEVGQPVAAAIES